MASSKDKKENAKLIISNPTEPHLQPEDASTIIPLQPTFEAQKPSQTPIPPRKLSQASKKNSRHQQHRRYSSRQSHKTARETKSASLIDKEDGEKNEDLYVEDTRGPAAKANRISFTPNFNLLNDVMLLPEGFDLMEEKKSPKNQTKRLEMSIKMQQSPDLASLKTNIPSIYNLNQDQVKHSEEFMRQFESFFGAEAASRSSTQSPEAQNQGGLNQSGSQVYKYNVAEEYFENLQLSGNFESTCLKETKRTSLNENAFKPEYINSHLSQELEGIKDFENILDFEEETVIMDHFSFEKMQQRAKTRGPKITQVRQVKKLKSERLTQNLIGDGNRTQASPQIGQSRSQLIIVPVPIASELQDQSNLKLETKEAEEEKAMGEVQIQQQPQQQADIGNAEAPVEPFTFTAFAQAQQHQQPPAGSGLDGKFTTSLRSPPVLSPQKSHRSGDQVLQDIVQVPGSGDQHSVSLAGQSKDLNGSDNKSRDSRKSEKRVQQPESELSFFYENEDEKLSDNSALQSPSPFASEFQTAPFVLISGAHCQGKHKNQCEDAYFITERAFGVSDGVSGWNDYGFSSDQFSLQLMNFSQRVIERFIKNALKNPKREEARKKKYGGVKRNSRSFLSMENLDITEENDEKSESESEQDSFTSDQDEEQALLDASKLTAGDHRKNDEHESKKDQIKNSSTKGNATERAQADGANGAHSPNGSDDRGGAPGKPVANKDKRKNLTLEEEIQLKLSSLKINQTDINSWKPKDKDEDIQQTTEQLIDWNEKRYDVTLFPTYVLEKAFAKVKAVGSATAMIAILNKQELSIANIGDSGFLVIRFKNGEPYCPHKSKEQQHAFNIPYQLSQLPTQADLEILRKRGKLTEMAKLKQVLRKKNNVCQDSPDAADDYTIELKDGDIVVSATDGVFDNLFQHEILTMVTEYKKTQEGSAITMNHQAQELATIMVNAAIDKFKNPKGKKTPYQRKYKKTYNATWEGGKEDDITVLITVARKVRRLCRRFQNPGAGAGAQAQITQIAPEPICAAFE